MRLARPICTLVLAGLLLYAGPLLAQKDGEGRVDSIIERTDNEPRASADAPLLYVTNQGEASVSVIDMEAHEEIARVDLQELGFSANAQPHHALAEPDGSAWYVSLISENVVLKFNRDNELVGQVEFEAPGLLTLHPQDDVIYIARSMMAVDPPQSIGAAQRSDMSDFREIGVFFNRPHALSVTHNGRFLYSASLATNQLIGIDTETERGELTSIEGPTQVLVQLVSTPDDRTIIGGGQITGQLLKFEAQDDGTLHHTASIQVGAQPWHPVIDSAGRYAYIPNKQSNNVAIVDLESFELVHTIEDTSFNQPHGSALSPDGRYLFVSNNHSIARMEHMMPDEMAHDTVHDMDHDDHSGHQGHEEHEGSDRHSDEESGTVSVIDLETREVVRVIHVGEYPTGMGTSVRH